MAAGLNAHQVSIERHDRLRIGDMDRCHDFAGAGRLPADRELAEVQGERIQAHATLYDSLKPPTRLVRLHPFRDRPDFHGEGMCRQADFGRLATGKIKLELERYRICGWNRQRARLNGEAT